MSARLFGNGSDIVQWEPSCQKRGTIDILTTCIITMLLCVWTAVHLSVPPPGSVWKPRFRKVGWLILALVAPELVAYTAWYQRQQALTVVREANKAYNRPPPDPWHRVAARYIQRYLTKFQEVFVTPKQEIIRQPTLEAQKHEPYENRHTWTLVHGFYAIMGGIALHVPEDPPKTKNFLPPEARGAWLLQGAAIMDLLKTQNGRNDLLNLSEAEIRSKSKANGLAKTIVCIQALWFIAQCLTRLAQRIPISLLELNTFGHAVCALLIYLLWWQKPFEVDFPTILEGERWWELCALLWMKDNSSPVTKKFSRDLRDHVEKKEKSLFLYELEKFKVSEYPWREADLLACTSGASVQQDSENAQPSNYKNLVSDQNRHVVEGEEGVSVTLAPSQNLSGTGFSIKDYKEIASIVSKNCSMRLDWLPESPKPAQESQPSSLSVTLEAQDITRWRMAWQAVERYNNFDGRSLGFLYRDGLNPRVFNDHICRQSKDMPDIFNIFDQKRWLFGFSVAAFVYGGLHALAWFAQFHSSTEQLLWRISAAVVMGGVPAAVGLFHLGLVAADYGSRDIGIVSFIVDCSLLVLPTLISLAYILARAYLVVECFISLSHLPAGVYDVPEWSSYFPHIA